MNPKSEKTAAGFAGWQPLRLVALAPLAGSNEDRPAAPVRIVADAIGEAMTAIRPKLTVRIPDPSQSNASLDLTLTFSSLDDLSPVRIVEQIPALAALRDQGGSDPAQRPEIDAKLSRALEAVLRLPAFLELEGAWRGLDFLAKRGGARADEGSPLILEAFVASAKEDWLPRFREQVFDPEYEDRTEVPLSAVVADIDFDHQGASLERLTRAGELMKALQVAFIGSVGAPFFGLKNLAHLPALPDIHGRTMGGPYAAWNGLQKEPLARWICLTVNRFLLRAPHGSDVPRDAASTQSASTSEKDETTVGKYRYVETVDPAHPEWLCWGRASWAVGVSLALSFAEHGHCAASDGLSGTGGHFNLPTREIAASPTKKVRGATEVVLSDEKMWELCRAGPTPILGMADGDVAYFPFLGNIFRSRPGSLTLDQSLAYQLYAGQLGHVVLRLLHEAPKGDPAGAARWLEERLFAHMSPFVGDKPGDGVKVVSQPGPGGAALVTVHVEPTFKIQDKPLVFDLQLPLE